MEIKPQALESFIVGPGVVDEKWPPLGDTYLEATRAVFKLL